MRKMRYFHIKEKEAPLYRGTEAPRTSAEKGAKTLFVTQGGLTDEDFKRPVIDEACFEMAKNKRGGVPINTMFMVLAAIDALFAAGHDEVVLKLKEKADLKRCFENLKGRGYQVMLTRFPGFWVSDERFQT